MKIYRLSVSPPYFNLPVCVDGDVSSLGKLGNRIKIQSTPSVGRATAKIYKYATVCLYIVHRDLSIILAVAR